MNHAELQEDLSLYALGALEPEERAAIEQHLAQDCAECAYELIAWREVVGTLGAGEEARDAPDLKPKLLRRLRGREEPVRSVPVRRRIVTWIQIGLPMAAALAMALYAALREADRGGSLRHAQEQVAQLQSEVDRNAKHAAQLQVKVDSQQEEVMRLTAELTSREKNVDGLRSALAEAEASLAVLRNPGLQMVRLTTPDAPRREAHALISRGSGRAILYAFELKAVSRDKAYELWWITEKQGPLKAGIFRPDARGLGRVEAKLPGAEAGLIQSVAVTVEPAAGVDKPTGPVILVGKIVSATEEKPPSRKGKRDKAKQTRRTSSQS